MCVKRWKISYTQGDLNDRRQIREALAYQNFLGSPAAIQSKAVDAMQGKDCDALLDGPMQPATEQCCLGDSVPIEGGTSYLVVTKKSLFPIPASTTVLEPSYLLDNVLALRRKAIFISNWTDDEGKTVLPKPGQVDCGVLARELGLCGVSWKRGSEIAILALQVKQAHKPTWLDSGLSFFWYAAPHRGKWGLTRSLETGQPRLREWMLPKQDGAFVVVEYWKRNVAQDCDLHPENLSERYWESCAKEIRP